MAERGGVHTRRDLETLLSQHDQALVMGAPGIGKSTRFDELASELPLEVYRHPEDVLESDHGEVVVLDDFYDHFTWYRTADHEDREAYRETVERQVDSEGSLFVCTTPYRLQWLLERHRETFDDLLGGLTGDWTVEPVRVDRKGARTFLDNHLATGVSIEEFEDEIEWRYELEDAFSECLHENEQFEDVFGDVAEYQTLIPGMLVSPRSDASLRQALSNRDSVLSTLKWMFKDVAASGAMSEGSSLIDGAREYAETLDTLGALDDVKSAVGSVLPDSVSDVPIEKLGLGAAGAALSGPALAVGCIGYWTWATHKEDEETRETVREEFGRILGSDVLELSPADREDLEAELELEPKTLLYLNQAASGVTWQKVERAIENLDSIEEDLEATIERVDGVEATVKDHDAVIEALVRRLRLVGSAGGYMTAGEFVDELYEYPEYVPPSYRVEEDESIRTEGVVEKLLDIVDGEQSSVTTIRGESGIGKSRLLAEVGLRLRDREDIETVYVRNPDDFREPTYASDTVVVFLDEAGGTAETENFFELTSGGWREYGVDCTVHVVSAYRPVYENEIHSLNVPNPASQTKIELERLEEEATIELLSDTSVSEEAARQIHETTEGNPFLSRLLALEEQDTDEARRTSEDKIKEVIDETMLEEVADLGVDSQAVRELLTVVAVLGEYDIREDRGTVTDLFDNIGDGLLTQHEILTAMCDARYLTAINTDGSQDTKFTHRIDVFAEYLRHRILTERGLQYKELIRQCVATSGPTIARGLIELRRSSLRRFDFFETETVDQEMEILLKNTAKLAVNENGPISDVIRVQAYVSLVTPGEVPYEELELRYEDSNPGKETADELFLLATRLYQHASNTAEAEDAGVPVSELPIRSSRLFAVAETWLSHLDSLAESHPDNDEIHLALANALTNAVNTEGEAERFEAVQRRLDRLEELVDTHPDNDEVHLELAKSLTNAIVDEGKAGRFDAMQRRLDRLEELAENHLDSREIIELVTGAHIFLLQIHVLQDEFKTADNIIKDLNEISQSLGRLHLNDRETRVKTALQFIGANLIRTGRLSLLEQLIAALQTGLNESQTESVCTDWIMKADDFLQEGEIDMNTYIRVVELCQG